jgi:hypothetical protein
MKRAQRCSLPSQNTSGLAAPLRSRAICAHYYWNLRPELIMLKHRRIRNGLFISYGIGRSSPVKDNAERFFTEEFATS